MSKLNAYLDEIHKWEYCYCKNCDKIRYESELEATERGIQCSNCGSFDLEAPDWITCPHNKAGAVKCARAGKGIKKEEYGYDCKYRCNFRKS